MHRIICDETACEYYEAIPSTILQVLTTQLGLSKSPDTAIAQHQTRKPVLLHRFICLCLFTSDRLPERLLDSIRDRHILAEDDIVERDHHALATRITFERGDGIAAALTCHHGLEVVCWVGVAAFWLAVE